MYSVNIRGYDVTCESTQEVLALVGAAAIPEPKQTRPTTPRATKGRRKTKTTAAQKAKRNKDAREAYKAKKAAAEPTSVELAAKAMEKQQQERVAMAAAEAPPAAKPKQHRADTSGEVIAVLRRSGLALTVPEIQDDLQQAGWKYNGDNPKNAIRSTLVRLVNKGTVAKGANNGDVNFVIARVDHADPLPHQQRETDV